MNINICGVGLAGLMAANYFRKHDLLIYELQKELPNNHAALLRFRTDKVAKLVGIPFRKVEVHKDIIYENVIADRVSCFLANSYAHKVTGEITNRSIWDTKPCSRYIAPPNLIELLAKGLDIKYGMPLDIRAMGPTISTIPMPALMKISGWKHTPQFIFNHIWSINSKVISPPINVYQTLYFPSPNEEPYRASLCGDQLIIECMHEPKKPADVLMSVAESFGIPLEPFTVEGISVKEQKYGKIVPIDEEIRQEFIYTMTRNYGIYSLGRFATWRQILLDDVADDIKVIEKLINVEGKRSKYNQSLAETKH